MADTTTTSRVLLLLSLLQSRRSWSGTELAERVDVSPRTIRRDIDRLRELGYTIDAERGPIGGYRLNAGSELPPLLFTGDEAVVLALALHAGAVNGAVAGTADLTVSVLAKLEQVLPSAVRARVQATQAAIVAPGPIRDTDTIDPESFAALALACRDAEVVRFDYTVADGSTSARRVEPVALVPVGRRWLLLAWDTGRDDWRTFRMDRIAGVSRTHLIAARRAVPGADAAAFVFERLSPGRAPLFEATVRISAPLSVVEARLGHYTSGLEASGEDTLWRIQDERVEILFAALAWLSWPFEVVQGDELREFLRTFYERGAS